ncbi:MAG: tRNA preQ1(34) S-adenosylmethionine ribosyltransferase-isomerase QueA [Polyangiaceae bacterium]|nr:tRNA preQ1(34) S-adenosylmethionine ribosyltransferase-isomerase QueA [Polyangiaceae bacterium]
MRLEPFDFELPQKLIAQIPAEKRDDARLLVLPTASNSRRLESVLAPIHAKVADLADHIEPGSLVVVNDTKVMRARIIGHKEGTMGRAEVFLIRKIEDTTEGGKSVQRWQAMGRASKPLRPGMRIVKGSLVVEFEGKTDDGLFDVKLWAQGGLPLDEARKAAGQVPLPPYIKRAPRPGDDERYQTVFARHEGAVAAPTAGLHLTLDLLQRLRERGCTIETCTLHIGLGTFQPVTVDDLDDHPMHAEHFEVSRDLAEAIARARDRNAPVVAIGTTVVRALESARDTQRPGHVRACAEETRLLVQPGFRFSVVDRLMTNFHLPKSTLLALVCAFGGTERVLDAYSVAVQAAYRFFSYGDAMLLDRAQEAQ